MAFLRAFGSYLPARVVSNEEAAARAGCEAHWIREVSGIEERRYAAPDETVATLAARAAEDCLARAGAAASELGMILVSSGSAERRFPGPAAAVAKMLGLDSVPSIDLPVASAGGLVAMSLAARLASSVGEILVAAAEKMSSVVELDPADRNVAVLFGDGAGACLVSPAGGVARIVDSAIYTDGNFTEELKLEFGKPVEMNGRAVILQASRKIPRAISELLARSGRSPADIEVFQMHQANQNLTVRVAQALGVSPAKFYSNIARYGNTSSASMLIAAAEWAATNAFRPGKPVCFAAFGAGFHWGALLAEGC